MDNVTILPDGSAFATASIPLPKDHWLTAPGYNTPPMPMRCGKGSRTRIWLTEAVRMAAKYAVRASTMNGKEVDFDPDAMVQNMVVGLLGYHTETGLASEDWADPKPIPPLFDADAMLKAREQQEPT